MGPSLVVVWSGDVAQPYLIDIRHTISVRVSIEPSPGATGQWEGALLIQGRNGPTPPVLCL